jgi:predicted nuclease of predicted toxin-antitoxin system
MKLLLDMGVSPRTAMFLRSRGHDAVHLRELGMYRAGDEEAVRRAASEGRILVTFDLDFPRILAATDATQPTLIVFRLEKFTTDEVNLALVEVLARCGQSLIEGAIVVVEPSRLRVRKLPIGGNKARGPS